jgi:hypothetical protein
MLLRTVVKKIPQASTISLTQIHRHNFGIGTPIIFGE